MARIWSEEHKCDLWLKIEILVCEAWAKEGAVPKASLETIKKKARYDLKRMTELEAKVKHDVIAFVTSVAEFVGPDSRYIHKGLTSSDLLDTAFSCQLVQAGKLIQTDIEIVLKILKRLAAEYKTTPMIGRTHGIHAEPVTFGLKLALWYAEFSRHLERLKDAVDQIGVGKISGAVGTFAHVPPQIEEYVCKNLNLTPDPISSQIVSRDRHAHYFSVLAGIAASIEKVAVEIRHLQRTEVFEAAEPFGKGQKGSSAMPHKRNPVLCENLSGLARIVRSNAAAAFENVALWHERDISHSSAERVIAPDSTILTDFMLSRLAAVLDGLDVFPERMKKNLDLTRGLYASQDLMLKLAEAGMTREEAYSVVQKAAMKSWQEGLDFKQLIMGEPAVKKYLNSDEIGKLFDVSNHFKHVDRIFKRVFK
jgi:adenylosuccinate lyase